LTSTNTDKKTIQTKEQAHELLFKLSERIKETMIFLNDFDKNFYQLSFHQLQSMRRTIDHNEEFFDTFFKNQTEQQIIEWINKESKKW